LVHFSFYTGEERSGQNRLIKKVNTTNSKRLKHLLLSLSLGCLFPWSAPAQQTYEPYKITDIVGSSIGDFMHVAIDTTGNLYMANYDDSIIAKATPGSTTKWVMTTIAGKKGSTSTRDGTNVFLSHPFGIAVDTTGNIYISQTANHNIRKLTPLGSTNWMVQTIVGKNGTTGSTDGTNYTAQFFQPTGLTVDSAGNLYVADSLNHTIRKVTPVGTNWVVTTVAGKPGISGSADGTNDIARFNNPQAVTVDDQGNLYVADLMNSMIRKITPVGSDWVVRTIAGKASKPSALDGTNGAAGFQNPSALAIDKAGNIFVVDAGNHTIRKVTPIGNDNYVVTTLAGSPGQPGQNDGVGSKARFDEWNLWVSWWFGSIAVDNRTGTLYIIDYGSYSTRLVKAERPYAINTRNFSGGQFNLEVTGPAGQPVMVDRSPDLQNWTPVGGTNTFTVGPVKVSDDATPPNGFYRARKP
jgi:hypothetical protein